MTGAEEVEDMTGMEDMTEMGDMTEVEGMTEMGDMTGTEDMKNDVRKERRASRQSRLYEVKLGSEHRSTGKLNLRS